MKRMISPEIFQIGECSYYVETLGDIKANAIGHAEKAYSSNRSEKVKQGKARVDEIEQLAENTDNDDVFVKDPQGSFGAVSNSSNRRRGTITPPALDALRQVNKIRESHKGKCECEHVHVETRRNSTGSAVTLNEQKDYFVSGQRLESAHRHCSEPAKSFHGKYSLVAEDVYSQEAIDCLRFRMRRNALCDPFRLPMPQRTRERLQRENERRKTSVARKVSMFFTVALDLNREEDLI